MSSPPRPDRRSFGAMGVEVVVGGASDDELERIALLFERWERVFSRFLPVSELNRVNGDPARVLVVSKLFASVLRDALAAAAATGGLVDPTLGRAVEAAGYDRDFASLADDGPLGVPVPGRWRPVVLADRVLSRPPGVELDLNGVVKALAVDAALEELSGAGYVSAGGDVAARGGIAVGLPAGGSLRVATGGVATSGTTRRSWRRGGTLQHHLIDPRTGRPSTSRWDEVTVAAASCLAADVAAKAAFLLSGYGPAWLDDHGLPGRFVAAGEVVENELWRKLGEPVAA